MPNNMADIKWIWDKESVSADWESGFSTAIRLNYFVMIPDQAQI
jgi:hypothetical protein